MTRKQKRMLARILITAVMLVALHFIPVTGWLRLALYLAAYAVIGYDIMKTCMTFLGSAPSANSTIIFCIMKLTTTEETPSTFPAASSIRLAQLAQSTSMA